MQVTPKVFPFAGQLDRDGSLCSGRPTDGNHYLHSIYTVHISPTSACKIVFLEAMKRAGSDRLSGLRGIASPSPSFSTCVQQQPDTVRVDFHHQRAACMRSVSPTNRGIPHFPPSDPGDRLFSNCRWWATQHPPHVGPEDMRRIYRVAAVGG